ncbi:MULTISPECIES: hypothetical protein [Kitasatospora]|uniref:2-hydroxy-acid oxidase n=1 Tax=Kitasatospora setae (strain ATCC 33774 / DSM 43861 / JCM 3304 / KCC A-0304 / NBRC 14216 / KM-6054) TaxID=452652 RepID=E4N2X5_KITSK|nr:MULTISPECIES: hypothetical protein [Kitasatospora]BAJ32509.1 hypothetical protein KSE_67510 [Kitasatospora setae KM-6054]
MPAETRGLRVTRAVATGADGHAAAALHPDLRTYTADLVRPYGLPLREDLFAEGAGHDYAELAAGLFARALPDGEPADLLILAFSSPDVRPAAPASLQLSRHCPGQPTAFAVCDQGSATAFTALRIAAAHHRTGGCRRAVIVLAEQSALHYRPAAPVELPAEHRAVLLVCEEAPGPGLRPHGEDQPDGAAALRTVLDRHRRLGPDARLLLSAGLAAHGDAEATGVEAAGVEAARPGQPFTGLWSLLADRLAAPGPAGPLLLADHDPLLGRLSTLTLP